MQLLPSLFCLLVILHCSYAPPVTQDKSKEQDSEVKDDLEEYMEYHRYLKEVVQALESDPDFRERLEKADEEDVRSGKIAEQLDFVNHNVRTKLDEIKRREMERLRHLATKQYELTNNLDTDMGKVPSNEHLDHANPHTFEIEDLKKLIKKTTADLEAADKQRREQFKEYEMQKEFEKHQKMENMDEAQKNEYMLKMKEEEEEKKHHKRLHHPGSKQQLQEVWEEQDRMDQQFDPKVFFMMHDVDGNGVWDADEVKALFIKELDKLYGPGGPNKDLHERAEEMERMREHVFQQNDHNRDGLIDFHEFLSETKKEAFNQDDGWKPIEQNQIYTQAEYQEYEKKMREGFKYLQEHGMVDAHGRPIPGAHVPPEYYHMLQQQQQHYQQQQQYQQQHYQQQQLQQQHFQQQQQQQQFQQQQHQQQQPQQQQHQQQQPQQHQPQQQQYEQPQKKQAFNDNIQAHQDDQTKTLGNDPVPQIYQKSYVKPAEYSDPNAEYPIGHAPPYNHQPLAQDYVPPNQIHQIPGQVQQGQPQIQNQAQAPQVPVQNNQGQAHPGQEQIQQVQRQPLQQNQGQAPPIQTQNQIPPANVVGNH